MALSVYARLGATALAGSQQAARIHVMHGGEELPSVAAYEYNEGYNAESWRQVAEYNLIDDLESIATGSVISIPPLAPPTT